MRTRPCQANWNPLTSSCVSCHSAISAHLPPMATRRAVLDEQGAAGLSLREVARRAGVTHQAPYHHFADRESILAELVTQGFGELKRRLARAHRRSVDPLATRVTSGVAYVVYALDNPGEFRIMFRADLCADFRHLADCFANPSFKLRPNGLTRTTGLVPFATVAPAAVVQRHACVRVVHRHESHHHEGALGPCCRQRRWRVPVKAEHLLRLQHQETHVVGAFQAGLGTGVDVGLDRVAHTRFDPGLRRKNLVMPSRVVQAAHASSSVARTTTSFSIARSAACDSSTAAHKSPTTVRFTVCPCAGAP